MCKGEGGGRGALVAFARGDSIYSIIYIIVKITE